MSLRVCIELMCLCPSSRGGQGTEISEFYPPWAELIRLVYEIYLKALAYVIVGAGKSEIHRAVQQTGNFDRSWYSSLEAEVFLPWGNFSFAFKDFPLIG